MSASRRLQRSLDRSSGSPDSGAGRGGGGTSGQHYNCIAEPIVFAEFHQLHHSLFAFVLQYHFGHIERTDLYTTFNTRIDPSTVNLHSTFSSQGSSCQSPTAVSPWAIPFACQELRWTLWFAPGNGNIWGILSTLNQSYNSTGIKPQSNIGGHSKQLTCIHRSIYYICKANNPNSANPAFDWPQENKGVATSCRRSASFCLRFLSEREE